MYAFQRQATILSGIATLVVLALVLWGIGAHMFTTAEAANLTYVKNTLSNSAPGQLSNHTIEFVTPTGVLAGQTIVVTFPLGFNLSTSSVAFGDVDMTVAGSDQTLAAAAAPGIWGVSVSGQDLILTSNNSTVAAGATVTIEVGNHASFGTSGTNRVTNATATTTSHEFEITAGTADSGRTRVAIIENVLVTADVSTILEFRIFGVGALATVNTSPTTTAATSTNTLLPFGNLAPGVSKTLAQDLEVETNARNGYVVTVRQSQNLLSSTGADIDGFTNGTYITAPAAWAAPSNSISDENTWGHWGLTSEDFVTGRTSEFSGDTWVAASSTPVIVMGHTGPADGIADGIGSTRVGYQIQITPLQEAGDDYNTTLTYVATPTF